MEKIIIGQISKPQGIKGEVKIYPLTDSVSRFNGVKEIYIEGIEPPKKVMGLRINANDVFMFIEGVITRNDAEDIRGKYISVDRKNAVSLEKGKYFIADIIGCKVYDNKGAYLGIVKDIIKGRSADVYEIKGEKNIMFPHVEGVILNTDVKNKKITVDEKRFQEVACYED